MSDSEDPGASLAGELAPDERLLWAGRPRRGLFFFRAGDVVAIPLSLLWCGIGGLAGYYMLTSAVRDNGMPWPIPAAFVLMMFLGLYMLMGRFFVDSRQRERTVYAVTNKRIIIRSGLFKQTTDALSLLALPGLTLKRHFGGRGTIIFGPTDSEMFFGDFGGWPGFRGRLNPPRFEAIDDAARVHEIIRAAQLR